MILHGGHPSQGPCLLLVMGVREVYLLLKALDKGIRWLKLAYFGQVSDTVDGRNPAPVDR